MKWVLIASVLNWQPVYDDQKTCQLAAEELKKVYYQEVAACIPKPVNTAEGEQQQVFEQFLGMVKKMQKELDNTGN